MNLNDPTPDATGPPKGATPPRRPGWMPAVIGFVVAMGMYLLVAYVLMPALWKR